MASVLVPAVLVLGGCAGGLKLPSVAGGPVGSIGMRPASAASADAVFNPDGATQIAPGGATRTAAKSPDASTTAPESAVAAAALPDAASPAAAALPPAVTLARALRAKGDKAMALAELERSRQQKPADRILAREAGLVALELGQIEKARASLTAALDPAAPDFHTLVGLGTVHASSGNQKEAQAHYRRALALRPDHRPTQSNLALSYVLDGDLAKAESTLKSASRGDTPQQVKENLALVLALAGKFDDAEKVAAGIMPKAKATANMAYVRALTEKEKGG